MMKRGGDLSSDSDKKKAAGIPFKEEDYAQVLIHKRRHTSSNFEEGAAEQRASKSLLKYNYFDSYLASSHEMASLDI